MNAKIIAYNYNKANPESCSDFSLNVYWGANYRNAFYVCGDFGRSTFSDIIETTVDSAGQTIRTKNTTIQRFILDVVAISPLMAFLKTIDKHDVKEIIFLETGESFSITNLDIDDQGDINSPTQLVYITFENEPITRDNDIVYVNELAKQGFWDNNNDGIKDIDGFATFEASNPLDLYFETWQLYYESDGTTPASSGNIVLQVYAESQLTTTNNPIESLVGVFRGSFGDLFSDSTKWQSTQNIWDYFNVLDSVGHANSVRFDKAAFAQDNGYYSDETEDKAVSLRFELSIDGSGFESTNLDYVYTVWGAFHSANVLNPVSLEYGITTLGKENQKNTLSTISDTRVFLPSGNYNTVTSPVINSFTPFSNTYLLGTTGANEQGFTSALTTPQGYIGTNYRGSYNASNFFFALDGTKEVEQSINVLNFTTGLNPYNIRLDYLYVRDTGTGGFPELGNIAALGDAEILLNGTVISNPPIAPATTNLTAFQDFTIPNTDLNTITFRVPTTTGYVIFTEFQIQLKPLY